MRLKHSLSFSKIFCNWYTGQFADKPTRSQSAGLVNSWTSQLANSNFFLNHVKIVISLYIKNLTLILTLSTIVSVQ